MHQKCSLVAQVSLWLPQLPPPFSSTVPGPAVITPSLGMSSELYMMLQAGPNPDHWTHLDYQDVTK